MKREKVIAWVYGVVSVFVGVLLVWGGGGRTLDRGSETSAAADGEGVRGDAGGAGGGEAGLDVGSDGMLVARTADRQIPQRPPTAWTDPGNGPRPVWARPLPPRDRPEDPNGPFLGGLPVRGSPLLEFQLPEVEMVATILEEAGMAEPMIEWSLRDVYGHLQRLAMFGQRAAEDAVRLAELNLRASQDPTGSRQVSPEEKLWLESWALKRDVYSDYLRRDLEVRLGVTDATVVGRLMEVAQSMMAPAPEGGTTSITPRGVRVGGAGGAISP